MIASHRIASHRIASHRLYCLHLQSLSSTNLYKKTPSSSLTKFLRGSSLSALVVCCGGSSLFALVICLVRRVIFEQAQKINTVKKIFSRWKNAAAALFISARRLFYIWQPPETRGRHRHCLQWRDCKYLRGAMKPKSAGIMGLCRAFWAKLRP
jgi:hypothetical protein